MLLQRKRSLLWEVSKALSCIQIPYQTRRGNCQRLSIRALKGGPYISSIPCCCDNQQELRSKSNLNPSKTDKVCRKNCERPLSITPIHWCKNRRFMGYIHDCFHETVSKLCLSPAVLWPFTQQLVVLQHSRAAWAHTPAETQRTGGTSVPQEQTSCDRSPGL